MPWGYVAATVVGGLISGAASTSAARTQAGAANQATDAQLQMFNQTRSDQAPYRGAGYSSLDAIMQGFGMPGSGVDANGNPLTRGGGSSGAGASGVAPGFFSHTFDNSDLNANLAPNYDFSLKQGQGAVTNFNNVAGGLGGNTLKAIDDYTQNYAQGAYQQAYTNYTANQTNIFNRLASIAGLGQTAGSNQTTGASAFGSGISNTITGAGNARAAGTVGAANAASGAAGGIGNYYLLQSLMNNGSGSPGLPSGLDYSGGPAYG